MYKINDMKRSNAMKTTEKKAVVNTLRNNEMENDYL